MEQIEFNLLFRWFVGLGMDDPVWDADARLYRKGNGRESRLCFMGHALMENRNGLVVGGNVTIASGTAEREAALELIDRHCPGKRRRTLGADKAYDVTAFVDDLRRRNRRPMWRRRIISPRPASGEDPDRRPRHASSGLRRQPVYPQADRGDLRLGQNPKRPGQDQVPGTAAGRCIIHLEPGGL